MGKSIRAIKWFILCLVVVNFFGCTSQSPKNLSTKYNVKFTTVNQALAMQIINGNIDQDIVEEYKETDSFRNLYAVITKGTINNWSAGRLEREIENAVRDWKTEKIEAPKRAAREAKKRTQEAKLKSIRIKKEAKLKAIRIKNIESNIAIQVSKINPDWGTLTKAALTKQINHKANKLKEEFGYILQTKNTSYPEFNLHDIRKDQDISNTSNIEFNNTNIGKKSQYDVYVLSTRSIVMAKKKDKNKHSKYISGYQDVTNPEYERLKSILAIKSAEVDSARYIHQNDSKAVEVDYFRMGYVGTKWNLYKPDVLTRETATNNLRWAEASLNSASDDLTHESPTIRKPQYQSYTYTETKFDIDKIANLLYAVVDNNSNYIYVYKNDFKESFKFTTAIGLHEEDLSSEYDTQERVELNLTNPTVIAKNSVLTGDNLKLIYKGKFDTMEKIFANKDVEKFIMLSDKVVDADTLFGKTPSSSGDSNNLSDANEDLFVYAMKEIDTGKYDKSLWIKAFALSGGNKEKQKAEYLQLRVKQLMQD